MEQIKRLYNLIDKQLFTVNGNLSYDRLTSAITRLANLITDTDTDENLWYIGENGYCSLSDLISGAYWHYTEYHCGQWSDGYAALSALGNVFSPGMTYPEKDNIAYQVLADIAN
ncbi:MAG: hypothetical protein GY941_21780 [Planctomycetes bacterium]|nr:hypothetical protein [Planctomycetota bacterium]